MMGKWLIMGGRIWRGGRLAENRLKEIVVKNEADEEIYLADEDIIVPGLYDLHCHLWGQRDAFGKGSLISLSPEHMQSTGVVGCSDAGSYGYLDWPNANRLWTQSNLGIKSWMNVLPEGLTTPDIPPTAAGRIDKERLEDLFLQSQGRMLGFKVMLGLNGADAQRERDWLRLARTAADECGAALMVHLTGSHVTTEEILDYLKRGDILAHIYNAGGARGTILDDGGEVLRQVAAAQERGILLEASSAFRHFSFSVYAKAHALGLEPDIIATDNNLRDFRRQPLFDLTHMLSKLMAAGMAEEAALRAAIDKPREYLGFAEEADSNLVILKYLRRPTVYQDTALPDSVMLSSEWTYTTDCIVYRNHCLWLSQAGRSKSE